MKKHLIMTCSDCNLRIELPSNITTISGLKEYFKSILPQEEEKSRFDLMDIR
jgi:hypothetical protein